jgi:hypothetical protein
MRVSFLQVGHQRQIKQVRKVIFTRKLQEVSTKQQFLYTIHAR